MNLTLKQRLWRLKELRDVAKDAEQNYFPARSDMTTKSQLPWAEKALLKIAAASVSIAMRLRQRRISSKSHKQKEITESIAELKRQVGLRVQETQDGRKS